MRFACLFLAACALFGSQAPDPPHLAFPILREAPSMAHDADLATWKGALEVSEFGMMMPDDKGLNRWPTVAHFAWGPDALYVAVEAFDPEPARIHSFRHKRDEFGDIDFVGLDLDPTGKGQSLIRLLVTPYGGQMDGLVTDNAEDYSYDCLWSSVGLLTPRGYLVKFRVPYSSLRRTPGDWGVRIIRVMPRERRYGIAWPPQSNDVQCNVCQAAQVAGAPVARPGSPFLVIPFVAMQRTQSLDVDPGAPSATTRDLGLDLRYASTAMTFEGTYRPDFNNVDTDVDPLQVNSRFNVYYPEKRPFFLEGMELLGIQGAQRQFYSRGILDPLYGVKASGTNAWGSWTILNAKDKQGGAMVDSFAVNGSPTVEDALPSRDTAAAMRFRTDNMGSGLSVVGTDKLVLGGPALAGGQSGGLYLTQFLTREVKVVASAVESLAHLPQGDQFRSDGSRIEEPQQVFRGTATSLELDWSNRNWYAWASDQGTSPGLVLVSGFTDLQGYRRESAGLGFVERWNQGALSQINLTLRSYDLHWWDGHPMDRSAGLDAYLETAGRVSFRMSWDVAGRTRANDEVTSNASRGLSLSAAWRRLSWAQMYVWAYQGRTIDLDNGWPARNRSIGMGSNGNVGSLAYGISVQETDEDREDDGLRLTRAREVVSTATWSLPFFFYVKSQAFAVRYDGFEEDGGTVDKFLKVFLGWQPNAFTNAYLGWSGQRRRDPSNEIGAERMVQRGLFAKFAYAFQF